MLVELCRKRKFARSCRNHSCAVSPPQMPLQDGTRQRSITFNGQLFRELKVAEAREQAARQNMEKSSDRRLPVTARTGRHGTPGTLTTIQLVDFEEFFIKVVLYSMRWEPPFCCWQS